MSGAVMDVVADMRKQAEQYAQIARKQPTVRLGHAAAAEVLFEFGDRVLEANQAERDAMLGVDARNCARYATYAEAEAAFGEFCSGECNECRFGGSGNCMAEWLMAKAGTEKGDGK